MGVHGAVPPAIDPGGRYCRDPGLGGVLRPGAQRVLQGVFPVSLGGRVPRRQLWGIPCHLGRRTRGSIFGDTHTLEFWVAPLALPLFRCTSASCGIMPLRIFLFQLPFFLPGKV